MNTAAPSHRGGKVSSNSASRKLGSSEWRRMSTDDKKFPVIQLLGSLEDIAGIPRSVKRLHYGFPVIQLLGSLEEHRSRTVALSGV